MSFMNFDFSNYESLVRSLHEFTKDEQIYLDFYENSDILPDDFRAKYPHHPRFVDIVLNPDKTLPRYALEEPHIPPDKNVFISKHSRYTPMFYRAHAFFEIAYVLSGTCTQQFHGEILQLNKGDLCFISPNVEHTKEVFDKGSVVINITVRHSTFMDTFENAIRDKTQISSFFLNNIYSNRKMNYLIFHTGEDEMIRNYILDMFIEQSNFDEYSDGIMCSMLMIFFSKLIRKYSKTMDISETYKQAPFFEKEILEYMIKNFRTVTLAELAEKHHFSVPYCSKLIKEATGYSFQKLLTKIKLQSGERLLLSTHMSVSDISERLGYENPETFIRLMKRHRNMTPSQYRQQRLDAN